jgi:hypothetical protein
LSEDITADASVMSWFHQLIRRLCRMYVGV